MKVLRQFKRFFRLYAQKLSGRAKTFRVAMLPCYPGFSASAGCYPPGFPPQLPGRATPALCSPPMPHSGTVTDNSPHLVVASCMKQAFRALIHYHLKYFNLSPTYQHYLPSQQRLRPLALSHFLFNHILEAPPLTKASPSSQLAMPCHAHI